MKTCYVDYDTRAIVDLSLLAYDEKTKSTHWWVGRVNVPREARGQGLARRLMQIVLDEADTENAYLYLAISPSDGLTYRQLEAWYKRLGFVDRTSTEFGEPDWGHMVRRPGAPRIYREQIEPEERKTR